MSRDAGAIKQAFETAYLAQYGVNPSHVPVEIVSWRLTVRGPDISAEGKPMLAAKPGQAKTHRPVLLWAEDGEASVYDRASLAAGQKVAGPAVIEERETTIVIPPHWDAEINESGCVVATRRA